MIHLVTCKGMSLIAHDKNTYNANTMLASSHLECSTTNLVLFITNVCHAFCFVNPWIPNNSIRKVGLLNRNNFAAFLVHNLHMCTYFPASAAQIPACIRQPACCWLISTMLNICCTLGQCEMYSSIRSGQGQQSGPVCIGYCRCAGTAKAASSSSK